MIARIDKDRWMLCASVGGGGLDDKDQQPQGTEHSGTERRPWRNGSACDL